MCKVGAASASRSGRSFLVESTLQVWQGLVLKRSSLQASGGPGGVPVGSAEAQVQVSPGRQREALIGAARPHCILSGCSCGEWYCTKVAPVGAAAARA